MINLQFAHFTKHGPGRLNMNRPDSSGPDRDRRKASFNNIVVFCCTFSDPESVARLLAREQLPRHLLYADLLLALGALQVGRRQSGNRVSRRPAEPSTRSLDLLRSVRASVTAHSKTTRATHERVICFIYGARCWVHNTPGPSFFALVVSRIFLIHCRRVVCAVLRCRRFIQ